MKSRTTRIISLCVLLSAASLLAFRGQPLPHRAANVHGDQKSSPWQKPGPLNVVVIVIDTLRADFLSAYGYPLKSSPFLDGIARGGIVFERAFSASSWTAPSTASIFTSLYPREHQVINGFLANENLRKKGLAMELNQIPKSLMTLPLAMRKAGYQTFGVSDNLNIGKKIGFDRGFDKFHKFDNEGAPLLNQAAREYLNSRNPSVPYFLYLHYMEPHEPYLEHEPFFSECVKKFGGRKKQRIKCAYASEINFLDDEIRKLATDYGWLGGETLLLVTADHGEEFWEHHQNGHGHTLYRELVNIPLLVSYRQCPAGRVRRKVSNMDIYPTIMDALDEKPDSSWRGRSLLPFCNKGPAWQEPRWLMIERLRTDMHPKPSLRALIHEDWHYIQTERAGNPISQKLFNLAKDWREDDDVAHSKREIVEKFETALRTDFSPPPAAKASTRKLDLDDRTVERLKSLGYFK